MTTDNELLNAYVDSTQAYGGLATQETSMQLDTLVNGLQETGSDDN